MSKHGIHFLIIVNPAAMRFGSSLAATRLART
jgi:hypothetical protein